MDDPEGTPAFAGMTFLIHSLWQVGGLGVVLNRKTDSCVTSDIKLNLFNTR